MAVSKDERSLRSLTSRRRYAASSSAPTRVAVEIFNIGNPHNNVSIRELAERWHEPTLHGSRRERAAPPTVSAESFYGPGYDDSEERIPNIDKAASCSTGSPARPWPTILPPIVDDYVVRYGS